MTGAYTEDTMMSQEGIINDNERKSLGGICEHTREPSNKQYGVIETREEEAVPQRPATGGCEPEEEQQTDQDRSVCTPKTCRSLDATIHVEAPVEQETLTSMIEEVKLHEENETIQNNYPKAISPEVLNIAENIKESLNDASDKGIISEKDQGCNTTNVFEESLTENLKQISFTPSEHQLRILDCSSDHGKIELQSYMVDSGSQLSFHEAVRIGDDKCVAALLASGAVENLNEPDWNVSGDPPLLVAASNHCLPVLSVLLANGCEPGVRSPRGESALHRAILNGASAGMVLSLVEELLKYGCPASVKEAGGGLTALHVLTRQLSNSQASKSLRRNFDAALKTLELLAKAGPINAKDHQGRSALHILASSTTFDGSQATQMESMLETFLAAGADPSLKNDRGETPLHESLECGALSTAFLLIPHTPTGLTSRYGETPLHIASRKNHVDVVAKLLERGEDPSVQDAGGNTPLHLASARGFHQTVSLLVISPLAQLEKLNAEGLTALQVAAESGFVNTVKLLLKAGADPSQTVHYCGTTLHRHPDISILIDHELTRRRQLAA